MLFSDSTKRVLQIYWHHVWNYPKYIIGILILIPLATLEQNYIPPLIVANILNKLSSGRYNSHDLWSSFGPQVLLYTFLIFFGSIILWRAIDTLVWNLEANVQRDLARRVFNHLLVQSANFHANSFGGSLVSRTNKLMGGYIRIADTTFFQVGQLFAGIIFTVVILATKAPLFVVLFAAAAIIYILVAIKITNRVRFFSAKLANSETKQTGYLADAITNVMAIKSFAGLDFENSRFDGVTQETRQLTLDLMRESRHQLNYLTSIINGFYVISVLMAVIGAVVLKANLATIYLILSYTAGITGQLFLFGNSSLRNYNRAIGDASDMADILALEPEVKDPADPEKVRIKKGHIELKHIQFTHDGAGGALFNDLNLSIKPGEKVGLVGHSGSGKSTFMRLLLRFSDIEGGEILIDGQNIAHITQDDLRRHLAYVPQEPVMFHRTLLENISYGLPKATKKEVIKAAKMAHATEFIDSLPDKYETLVGERGIKLSGGQRQRIAIARAILKNAPIIVLDEATSSLDSESELFIQDALWKLMEGRTTIVIAHRLSTIQHMDRIIVMDDGKVVEEGSHQELLKKNGVYAKLWAHQSGGFISE